MKLREFNKIINSCRNKSKTLLDIEKLDKLDVGIKHNCALFINFITPLMDINWLHSMGYLYISKGKDFTFQHTCEHEIK